ncbi:hypothetical protein [Yoonia sp. SDW83-1]|uniref:hypothetical protein n=1 Tax=Yoonia sp. SDW83-1 TaxID=3366945 RepID=UPI00398C3A77
MPFRTFALIVIGVIAASAGTVWLMSAIAIHFQVRPMPMFVMLGLVAIAAFVAVRRRNG